MAPALLSPPLITTSPSTLRTVSPTPSSRWCRRARPLASSGSGFTRDRRRSGSIRGRRGLRIYAYTAEAEQGRSEEDAADDFYSVLGVMPDATTEEIKKAYYSCMKTCHPDLSGDDPDVTNVCMFVNEVYTVLTDPVQRAVYDELHGYAATAANPFFDDSAPKDQVFVDEFTCIGCKICANVCPNVFEIEEDFGRSRVCSQTCSPDLIQDAIDSCPVDCIHWTSAAQLSLLENEMRRIERVNVGLMNAGMGVSVNVFRMASTRWEKRQAKVLERIRTRMINQKNSDPNSSWSDIWGSTTRYQTNDEEAVERANRAARAATRWREYSRKGTDKSPRYKLPEAVGKDE
ncbi:chaperone protein dnaJ C76, chloroplastic-like isoform X1 [Lolium rigidum]|uniref:chaperone protein dnaJ C76, chloroplastic-like isoform X1 n=1 Tax=Lolium rigidum TaxID=89674 RepID=UPI001F5D3613|nr:chaperone protein dnaJ C76, chloroplastic-like isoform X1 [Lolium rigidum]